MSSAKEYSGAKHRSLTLLLYFLGLLINVLIDTFLSQSWTYRSDEIPCHPNLASPVHSLEEFIFLEQMLS